MRIPLALAAFAVLTACSSAPATTDAGVGDDAAAPQPPRDAAPDVLATVDAGVDAADAASTSPTLFGAAFNPHDTTRHAALVSQWGGMQVVRSYDGSSGVTPFLKTYESEDVGWGAASAYSFKYPPSEVLAGTDDADLQSFFEGIADGHVVYWTYYHEPDDQIFKDKTFTASDYRAAWAHIRAIADGVKAKRPNLAFYATFICMSYSMTAKIAPSRPLTGPNGMYPGDNVIDVFGVDAYNVGEDKGNVFDAATQFGVVIDFAKQHGKPWAIGELGSCPVVGDPNGRATYLKNAFDYWVSRAYPPVYVAYFDVDWTSQGACDYRFDDDAAATAVWSAAVKNGIGP